jgi:hypothetical protein
MGSPKSDEPDVTGYRSWIADIEVRSVPTRNTIPDPGTIPILAVTCH